MKKAFTLIETLVAVSLLVIAALGPLSVSVGAVKNSLIAKDQIIASYLAQESIEYVRYVRDTNAIYNGNVPASSRRDFLDGLSTCTSTAGSLGSCLLNSPNLVIYQCDINNTNSTPCNQFLKINSDGYYVVSNSDSSSFPDSIFSRYFRIIRATNDTKAIIESTVSWKTGNYSKTITLKETLYDIY